MRIRLLAAGALLAGLAMLAGAEDAGALLIDNFSTAQSVGVFLTPDSAGSQVSGSGILGGERDMWVTLDSGSFINMAAGSGALTHMQVLSSLGTGLIVWDGVDDDPRVDYTGLGSADFTNAGAEDRILIPLLINNLSAPVTLTAYTDADNYSEVTVTLPGGIPPGPQTTLTVLFTDFAQAAGASGGADFSDIGAFSLRIDGSAALDLNAGFGTIPEPSTATLLLFGALVAVAIRHRQQTS
jgi:hypothetical protein